MFFFPIVCAVYFVVPRKLRVLWLLVCSYAFYMAWNVKYAGLMAVSTLATYVSGLALDNAQNELKRTVPDSSRKAILAACIVFNLAILGVFKYGNPNTIVKTAVNLLGYPVGKCRAPFNQVPEEGIEALKQVLAADAERGVC